MSGLVCPSCSARLLPTTGHAGAEAACPACGATIAVPDAPPPPPAPPAAEQPPAPRRAGAGAWLPPAGPDPAAAGGGDVPPPRASGSGEDAQLPLVLAAASLLIPILGPIAWWLVQRAAQPIRERGDEEPATMRHARLMAMTGTALLVLAVVCCGPVVLVIG